ncbi:MAG: hypothetical protein IT285_13015 [Bdellovibrionales bacterium]|nr:hypothetical protein [Bdellovibrionales bacterium]
MSQILASRRLFLPVALLAFLIGGEIGSAQAGVFDIPHFVMPGAVRVGLEPELTLTEGSGLAVNLKGTYGLDDLINLQFTIGTGGGPQRFRIGAAGVFDFFPDVEGQPGIGIAAQMIRYDTPAGGLLDLRAIPYIHKSFKTTSSSFEPYLAFPMGFGLGGGDSVGLVSFVLGSIFHSSESMHWTIELGVPISNTETQFSGGVSFYF